MRVLLAAHGSRGDVYPMIALATRLRDAGHEVSMMTQGMWEEVLDGRGVRGMFTSEDMRDEMVRLQGEGRSLGSAIRWARKSLEEEFSILGEASRGADVLVCTNNEFSATSIAEARDIPAFRLAYLPAIPGGNVPPLIPWQDIPSFLCRPTWALINMGLDLMVLGGVNRGRAALGMKPLRSLATHFMATYRNLFAINAVLAPPHPSWPPGSYRYCGYAFEQQDEELPARVLEFLDDGEAPIYLGFGSVSVAQPRRLTEIALEAAERTDSRLVISRGWTGLGLGDMPRRAIVVDDLPHDRLFPRMAGVCHHGGSGTTHRAARAGVPQFIMPTIVDQFFWGRRVYDLCLGPRPVTPRKVTVRIMTGVFKDMKENESYRQNARRLATAVAGDGGLDAIQRVIEEEMAGKGK